MAMADRPLITKCDLADAPCLRRFCQRLSTQPRRATLEEVSGGVVAADAILGCGLYDPPARRPT